ncbi:MAG: hypothetical protein LBM27_01890 [Lactobacillaceae bacterium]|jgi:hypothetical protein|nr:hypothetical protein [Lactobacillaceae bacterium]
MELATRKKEIDTEQVLNEAKKTMFYKVYDQLMVDLPKTAIEYLKNISQLGIGYQKVESVIKLADTSSSHFSVYREKLKTWGVIDTEKYGYVKLRLPYLQEYFDSRA